MTPSPFLSMLRARDPRAFFQISGDWKSLLRLHFLYASLESGLLKAMDRKRTREDLIRELGAKRPELLDGLLELGVRLGELSLDPQGYSLKGSRSRALREDRNDALAAMVEANVTYYNSVFRGFARRLRGGDLEEDLAAIGPLVARVSKIAEPYVHDFLERAVEGKGPLTLLDVGCGSCSHLRRALELNPEIVGIGLESDPEVVMLARENLRRWKREDRIRVEEGDIRSFPFETMAPFDLVLLFSVIYYFDSEERLTVLRRIRGFLAPGGEVALVTSCRGPGIDLFSANLNLATSSMAGLTPLPEPEELEGQLREAGYTQVRRSRLIPRTTYFGIMAS